MSIRDELECIRTDTLPSCGLPWNAFGWYEDTIRTFSEVMLADVIGTTDKRFSARGVVMKLVTMKGVYFLKCCPQSSVEPSVVKITSRNMADVCDVAEYVDCDK